MKKIRAYIRLVFGFSQTETNAFLLLLPLMLIVITAEPVYQTWLMSGKPDNFVHIKKLDSLSIRPAESIKPVQLFSFDPNKATEEQLTSLGIPPKTAAGIINYRNKGGQFRVKADLRKMYGLDTSVYNQLQSFILLPEQQSHVVKQNYQRSRNTAPKKEETAFDLNTADTTQLKSVYGIGPTLAKRIVTYRDNLGGFIDVRQLYEVWGLDSAVVMRLAGRSVVAPGFMPNRLSINRSSEQELARHPYIRTKLARAIVNYRFQHGNFVVIEDLNKISLIDEKAFLRIKPYTILE